jgi:hypothetical protein
MHVDPVLGHSMPEGAPQHRSSSWKGGRELGLEAKSAQGLGDGRDVGRRGGQEQVDDVLAGQAGHCRAADMLGRGGWPAARDERDETSGGLGGARIGLVDLDRRADISADGCVGWAGRVRVGCVRVSEGNDVVHEDLPRIHGPVGRQQQHEVGRSRDGDGDVSQQWRKGLDPAAIVNRIEFGRAVVGQPSRPRPPGRGPLPTTGHADPRGAR